MKPWTGRLISDLQPATALDGIQEERFEDAFINPEKYGLRKITADEQLVDVTIGVTMINRPD